MMNIYHLNLEDVRLMTWGLGAHTLFPPQKQGLCGRVGARWVGAGGWCKVGGDRWVGQGGWGLRDTQIGGICFIRHYCELGHDLQWIDS